MQQVYSLHYKQIFQNEDSVVQELSESLFAPLHQARDLLQEDYEASWNVLKDSLVSKQNQGELAFSWLQHARQISVDHEKYLRDVFSTYSHKTPSNPVSQAYLAAQSIADKASQEATKKSQGPLAKAASAHQIAAQACVTVLGIFSGQTQFHIKALMRIYFCADLLSAASLMATQLHQGQALLQKPDDSDLLQAIPYLFEDVALISDRSQRIAQTEASVAACRYFENQVGEKCRAKLSRRIAYLVAVHTADCASLANETRSDPVTQLKLRVQEAKKGIHGLYADAIESQVLSYLEEFTYGASDSHAAARIWLERFVALSTGYPFSISGQIIGRKNLELSPAFAPVAVENNGAQTRQLAASATAMTTAFEKKLRLHCVDKVVIEGVLRWVRSLYRGSSQKILSLEGPSASGKTMLATVIAQNIYPDSHIEFLNLGGISGMEHVTGTGMGILSAHPSTVAKALMNRKSRPIILVINEVCKGHDEIQNWLASALELQEPVLDNYFGFPIDLSTLTIICTYNDEEKIVSHLKSRITPGKVVCAAPSAEHNPWWINKFLYNAAAERGLPYLSPGITQKISTYYSGAQDLRTIKGWCEDQALRVEDFLISRGLPRVLNQKDFSQIFRQRTMDSIISASTQPFALFRPRGPLGNDIYLYGFDHDSNTFLEAGMPQITLDGVVVTWNCDRIEVRPQACKDCHRQVCVRALTDLKNSSPLTLLAVTDVVQTSKPWSEELFQITSNGLHQNKGTGSGPRQKLAFPDIGKWSYGRRQKTLTAARSAPLPSTWKTEATAEFNSFTQEQRRELPTLILCLSSCLAL